MGITCLTFLLSLLVDEEVNKNTSRSLIAKQEKVKEAMQRAPRSLFSVLFEDFEWILFIGFLIGFR